MSRSKSILRDIGFDLLVRQHGAEAQQPVAIVEREEVLEHAPAVALAQLLDHHRALALLALSPVRVGAPASVAARGLTDS